MSVCLSVCVSASMTPLQSGHVISADSIIDSWSLRLGGTHTAFGTN